MQDIIRVRIVHILVLSVFFLILTVPQLSNALRPLDDEGLSENSLSLGNNQSGIQSLAGILPMNDNQLDDLSPSLIAPVAEKKSPLASTPKMSIEFENSICFKQCHQTTDFHPSENTAKQWRLLIEDNGHSIFTTIPWDSPLQKEEVLNYLINDARKATSESAGIGVW